jgi:phosphatidylglycerophosphate synthase
MNTLRIILIVVTSLVALSWIALLTMANGFRRSFGASENAAWKLVLPVAVLTLLLASLLAPNHRWLLHVSAVVVVALVAGCSWLWRESPAMSVLGLSYCALWFVFYRNTIFA